MTAKGQLNAVTSFVVFLTSISLVFLHGCGRDRESDLVAAVPGLDREVAHHLVTDDDSTLAFYARRVGIYPLRAAAGRIIGRLQSESVEQFLEDRETLLPILERIGGVYRREFYSRHYEIAFQFWSEVSAEDAVRLGVAAATMKSTQLDTTLSTAAKLDTLTRLLPEFNSIGFHPNVINCKHEIGHLLAETDRDEQLRYYRSALADAERADYVVMVCQILGTLGHDAAVAGNTDSMVYYWNRSLEVAERHKIPDFTGRIYSFYAQYYRSEGRLALAHDLLHEAQSECRRLKGGYRELRFVVGLLEFYNDLECWDVSGRLLPRADLLKQQVPENPYGVVDPFTLRSQLARARYLMANAQVEEAEDILNNIRPLVRQQVYRDQYPRFLYMWGKDLLANGRPDAAASLIDEGLSRTLEVNYPNLVPMFYSLRAELEFARGNHDAALSSLARFEQATRNGVEEYEREWIVRDVIRTRILWARGLSDSAVTELEMAFGRFERYLSGRDASTHGYLWMNQCDELRALLHELAEDDPVVVYGAELYWRQLYQSLGGNGPSALVTADGKFIGKLYEVAADAHRRLQDTSRIHCHFYVVDGQLYRVTATPEGIRNDKLPVPVPELRRLVSEAWVQLSADSVRTDASIPRSLVTPLRALALQLLPPEILDVRVVSPQGLLISADGFLASLPFETLNLAADGSYRPLLMDWDIAYLRRARSRYPARHASTEVLVSDPALSAQMRRRLSVSQPLPAASKEADEIASQLEDPVVLRGSQATKQRLTAAWEDASLVYVAAHFLTNPEVSYLTMLPLADPGLLAPRDAALLDVADVRAANLSGCDLVVLSGCATGAPQSAGRITGPGFGDVFLDAGAGAVVHTFWAVRDDLARAQMAAFVGAWRSYGRQPVRAICEMRRDALAADGGIRHPYLWAAFSIQLGHL